MAPSAPLPLAVAASWPTHAAMYGEAYHLAPSKLRATQSPARCPQAAWSARFSFTTVAVGRGSLSARCSGANVAVPELLLHRRLLPLRLPPARPAAARSLPAVHRQAAGLANDGSDAIAAVRRRLPTLHACLSPLFVDTVARAAASRAWPALILVPPS